MGITRPILACAAVLAGMSVKGMEVFTVDHARRADSPADVRFLLDAPAGKHGFVVARAGHLCTEDGHRIRFWGVNDAGFTLGSALLPAKPDAAIYAAELARLGINCVRFQFLDLQKERRPGSALPRTLTPSGLIASDRDDTREFDPEQVDRLDYLIAQLKANGVYTDLNLNVGRRYKKGDGVPDYDLIGVAKGVTYFEPRLVELQKEYARMLLTHRNPYTGLEYRNDPAIAIVEIVNENSVLEFWQRNWLRGELTPGSVHYQLDLTPAEKTLLTDDFNHWLAQHRPPDEVARLRREAGVGPSDPVPLTRRPDFDRDSKERFYTEAAFYTQMESGFLTGMESYLKHDLGVHSLVIGTADHTYWIPGLPLLRSTSKLDIVDAHVYWQHPAISGRRDTPMVDDPLHSMAVKLTRSTLVGKPFTVSEVNEPFPNDYACEMIPILASYGAFQDWDGIFIYALEPKVSGEWQPVVGDHFDIAQDPVKIAQMPAGALIFLRGDVHAAKHVVTRAYSPERIYESMRLPASEDPYFTPGFPLSIPLEHGSRIACLDCAPTQLPIDAPSNPIRSDTGELAWYRSQEKGGLVTIDTDRTSALVGFVRAHGVSTSHLAADVANRFCALTLSSLDGEPISRSGRLLLTTGGRVENSGSVWNARHTMFDQWGGPPTLIEPVKGWLLLKQLDGAVGVRVTPLDGASRPLAETAGRLLESGWEIQIGDVPATTYLIQVIH